VPFRVLISDSSFQIGKENTVKRTIILSLVLIFAMLAGCVPAVQPAMPTDVPQAATSAPAATTVPPTVAPTKVPPTATPVPPTATPVPLTATPVPPTATTEPDLAAVISTAGYVTTTSLLPKGFKIGDLLEVQMGESYKKGTDQFVHIVTFPLPSQVELGGFNLELENPNFILLAVVTALKGVGIDARSDLAGAKIADLSKGVSFSTNVAGAKQKIDVLLFRRGTTGAIVIVMRPDGATAAIDVNLVAQKLDKKIAAGK